MTNKELAIEIIDKVGGKTNVISATNCMTRLRMKISDISLVKMDELKAIDGVLGVVQGDTLQVVLGPGKASRVADEVAVLGISKEEQNNWKENKAKYSKESKLKSGLKVISSIFVPMLPAIIAAGIFNGFAGLTTNLMTQGHMPTNDFTVILNEALKLLGGAFFTYFAIFTGVNAAKAFGATEVLGGVIGGISIAPQVNVISDRVGLFDNDSPLNSILRSGKGGIIGVILGVWILAKIEKKLKKVIPETLDLILRPMIAISAVMIVMLFVLMPLSGLLSDGIVNVFDFFLASELVIVKAITGFLLAASFLPMVLLGLHHGLIPIYTVQLAESGAITLFPILAMAGAGQVGAAIAIYIKAKRNKRDKLCEVISGALPAGFLGVGEPLIYGVTLPLGKPFITAGLGAGIGAAYIAVMNVSASAFGPSGIPGIALITPEKIVHFVLGLLISYIAGFIITWATLSERDFEKAFD